MPTRRTGGDGIDIIRQGVMQSDVMRKTAGDGLKDEDFKISFHRQPDLNVTQPQFADPQLRKGHNVFYQPRTDRADLLNQYNVKNV